MKFEVLYANGIQNEVELPGHTVVVGRDPACDLVLNDNKCSRRHAVVEMGPSGLAIRDNGSANGVFVNGRKVERSPLVPGDVIRVGETVLTILAESTGTVVMADDDVEDYQQTEDLTRPHDLGPLSPAAAAPAAKPPRAPTPGEPVVALPPRPPAPQPPKPSMHATPPPMPARPPVHATPPPMQARPPVTAAPAPPKTGRPRSHPPAPAPPSAPAPVASPDAAAPKATRPAGEGPTPLVALARPLTVTALAVMWLVAGALYGAVGLGFAIFGTGGRPGLLAGAAGVLLAVLSGALGLGLWTRAPWARLLQLALAGIGVFTCVFTLPSLAILAYMLRPEIQLHFAGARALSAEESEKARTPGPETAFTLAIVGTLALSVLLTGITAYVGQALWNKSRGGVPETQAPPAAEPGRN